MPYIERKRRTDVDYGEPPSNPGELTYVLTLAVDDYTNRDGKPSFSDYAEAIGALEATKLELYRRRIAGYEDHKLVENGDVYA